MYYPEDLRENTTVPPPPTALPLPPPEQSLTTQEPSRDTEVLAGAKKDKDGVMVASQTEEKAKEKEKEKEKAKEKEKEKEKAKNKADAHAFEDTLVIGDMVSKAKATESKSKIDSKKDSHQSQT